MGRLGHEPTIQHFSHHHTLELICNPHQAAPPTCAGCRQATTAGAAYACRPCNYFLHAACAQTPQFISHPAHPSHALALLAVPAYREGFFNCDACGQKGTGFSYHCGACDVDVHTVCASVPLSLTHPGHNHPLGLAFFPPYQNKGFSCDLCGNSGANHWLYRCSICEFDAHLGCATAKPRQPAQLGGVLAVNGTRRFVQQQVAQLQPAPAVGLPARLWAGSNFAGAPAQAPARMGSNVQAGDSMVNQAIQGLLQGAAEQVGQSLVQNLFGGGGGGGDTGGN